ncbi:MAG: hypothetical protein JWR44_1666 [Hymenobacter sp.]|nr:hypothetical protein [Hymenobacter sp.]
MNVLVVNSGGRTEASVSRQLVAELVEHLASTTPDLHFSYRDAASGLPFVNDEMIAGFFTPEPQRTAAQQQAVAFSNQLVAEVQAADVLVLGTPIYNFGLPAALKAYIDLICRAGLTFRFTETGVEGLLRGKKAYLVVSSGSTEVGSAYDFATPHLRAILGFVGITDVEIIHADQLAVLGEASLVNARLAIQGLDAQLV